MRSRVLTVTGIGVAIVALTACGNGKGIGTADAPTPTKIPPTNYVTIAPVTTTTGPTTTLGADAPQPEQQYTIKTGDYLYGIAKAHNVKVDDIVTVNGWTDGVTHKLNPGDVIKIPAGGTLPGATTTVPGGTSTQTTTAPGSSTTVAGSSSTTVRSGSTTTAKSTTTATTIKGGQSNCAAGDYTIQKGDVPSTVAKNFGTTVAALDAANASTKGYSSFYVGLKIKIPAKTSC